MALNFRKLEIRAATAVIAILVLGVFILFLPKWCFHVLLAVLGLVGTHEARRLAGNFGVKLYLLPVLLCIFLGIGSLYLAWFSLAWLIYLVVAVSVLLALIPPSTLDDMKKSLPNAGVTVLASAYLGFALISTAYLFNLSQPLIHQSDAGRTLLVFCILMVWAGDSSAYLVGSMFGKHKISPVISPNKTYEGTIANLAGNFLFALIAKHTVITEFTYPDIIFLSLVFGILGFYGDLVESAWKRGSGIKDSGSLLPGHGGVLDRLDSIFLTAPLFYVYVVRFVLS